MRARHVAGGKVERERLVLSQRNYGSHHDLLTNALVEAVLLAAKSHASSSRQGKSVPVIDQDNNWEETNAVDVRHVHRVRREDATQELDLVLGDIALVELGQ